MDFAYILDMKMGTKIGPLINWSAQLGQMNCPIQPVYTIVDASIQVLN